MSCDEWFCHSCIGGNYEDQLVKNVLNLCNNDLIISKELFVCHMLSLLQLEANFFKRPNLMSNKVSSSWNWPDIGNIKTIFVPLASSTFDAPCNIIRVEIK